MKVKFKNSKKVLLLMSVVFTSLVTMSFALSDDNTTEVSAMVTPSQCNDYCKGVVAAKGLRGRPGQIAHRKCVEASDYCNPTDTPTGPGTILAPIKTEVYFARY